VSDTRQAEPTSRDIPAPLQASTPMRAWFGVGAVALAASVFVTTEFLPVGLLTHVARTFGVSTGEAGLMVTGPGLVAAFAAPGVTIAVRHADRRLVLCALTALLAASDLFATFAPSFGVLLLARLLFGVGLGGFWAIGAGLGARLVADRSVGQATAIIFAGVSIGTLLGVPAGALIANLAGWRAAFSAALGLSGLSLLGLLALLPPLHVESRVTARDLFAILKTRYGRISLAGMTLALSAQFATYTYIGPFLEGVSGFAGKTTPAILLAYTTVGVAGNFLAGATASRNLRLTLLGAIALLMGALVLLPVAAGLQSGSIALLAVWGLAYGGMPVALQLTLARAAGQAPEGGSALFVANYQASIAFGSLLGGQVVDRLGLITDMHLGALFAALALALLGLSGLGAPPGH
jgi:predicted MFS family arabinose efflux permease